MLLERGRQEWGVKAQDCHVEDGVCVSPNGKRLTFGQPARVGRHVRCPRESGASSRPVTSRFIGTPVKRLDTPLKVDGTAQYGIDVRLPDMLYAALTQPPTLGGKVKSFDDSAAKTMPGYKATVQNVFRCRRRCRSWYRARKARATR